MENQNLSQLVAMELRKRGNKTVKSLFWNSDVGNLSVIVKGHTFENPKNFNYSPEVELSVEEIADYIEQRCDLIYYEK